MLPGLRQSDVKRILAQQYLREGLFATARALENEALIDEANEILMEEKKNGINRPTK